MKLKVEVSSTGHVTKISLPDELKHTDILPEEFLAHYGIKGMRWGVRRDRDGGKGSVDKHSSSASADHIQARAAASKSVSSLSNQELKQLVERMNLESQYSKLSSGNNNSASAFVQRALQNAAQNYVQSLAQKVLTSTGEALLKFALAKLKNG